MPGRFMPFPAETRPPTSTRVSTRPPRTSVTRTRTAPSAIRISCPGAATSASPSNVTPSSPTAAPSPDPKTSMSPAMTLRGWAPAAIRSFGP